MMPHNYRTPCFLTLLLRTLQAYQSFSFNQTKLRNQMMRANPERYADMYSVLRDESSTHKR